MLVLVALVFAARRGLAYWRRVRRRRLLLDQLDQLRTEHDPAQRPQDYLAGLNQLLKLVALRAFPDRHCAALQGPDWAAFIATGLDDREVSALKVLATGPYQPAPDFDAEAIDRVAREWVRKHG